MNSKNTEIIREPKHGTVVKHTGRNKEDDPNYPCDVYITRGTYLSYGRVCNFWYWRRVLQDGSLGPAESGYGSFEESPNKYEIEIKAKKKAG